MAEDGDAVGKPQRLFLIVGDVEDGDAGLLMDAPDLVLDFLAQLLVERRQRLVHQQDRRIIGKRPGQRDALLLAAGQLRRHAVLEALEPHQLQHRRDFRVDLGLGRRRTRNGKAIFSPTDRCGNSV